jgi:hypothetical protein
MMGGYQVGERVCLGDLPPLFASPSVIISDVGLDTRSMFRA